MIEVENLSKKFKKVQAVNGLSFTAPNGKVVGLLGANGAGKSTTMRMIAATIKPGQGSIRIDGVDVARHAQQTRRLLGVMPEGWGLYDHLTPRDHLRFYGRLFGIPSAALEKRIEELVGLLKMEEYANRKCEKFSKGMKQKVSLARTLLHNPPNLLLDEPTSGLDVMSARQVREIVASLRNENRSIILSTHILSEAERMCDWIVMMDGGNKKAEGSVDDLLQRSGKSSLEEAFISLIGREDVEVQL